MVLSFQGVKNSNDFCKLFLKAGALKNHQSVNDRSIYWFFVQKLRLDCLGEKKLPGKIKKQRSLAVC